MNNTNWNIETIINRGLFYKLVFWYYLISIQTKMCSLITVHLITSGVHFKTNLRFFLLPSAFCDGLCLKSSVPAFVLIVHVSLWIFTTVQVWSSSSFKSSGAVESVEAWSLEHSPNVDPYYSWPLVNDCTWMSSELLPRY